MPGRASPEWTLLLEATIHTPGFSVTHRMLRDTKEAGTVKVTFKGHEHGTRAPGFVSIIIKCRKGEFGAVYDLVHSGSGFSISLTHPVGVVQHVATNVVGSLADYFPQWTDTSTGKTAPKQIVEVKDKQARVELSEPVVSSLIKPSKARP